MPIQFQWDDEEHTIFRLIYENHWNWEEFERAVQAAAQAIGIVNRRVDVIDDHSQSLRLPSGTLAAWRLIRARLPQEVMLVVVVSQEPLIESMHRVFINVYPAQAKRFLMTSTLEEAYQIIQDDRAK